MPAPTFTTTFLSTERCCAATDLFRLARPGTYRARPGQWFRLTLDTREGPQTKTFSDAAAPSEPTMDIATRLTGSAFKDALAALEPGVPVTIAGPGGRLGIPEGARRVAFLMGGVGIAPARSMIRDRVLRADLSTELVLFYGNNDEECVPFDLELRDFSERWGFFRLIEVIAEPHAHWIGERGFMTPQLVERHIDPHDGWHFIVAGPPAMLEPMRTVLDALEVPAEHRSFESFGGPGPERVPANA